MKRCILNLILVLSLLGMSISRVAYSAPSPIAHFNFVQALENVIGNHSEIVLKETTSNKPTIDDQNHLTVSGEEVGFSLDLTNTSTTASSLSILLRVSANTNDHNWGISLSGEDATHPRSPQFIANWEQNTDWGINAGLFVAGISSMVPIDAQRVQSAEYNFAPLLPADEWYTLGFVEGQLWVNGQLISNAGNYYTSHYHQLLALDFHMDHPDGNLLVSDLLIFDQVLAGEEQIQLMEKYSQAIPEPTPLTLFMMGAAGIGILTASRRLL